MDRGYCATIAGRINLLYGMLALLLACLSGLAALAGVAWPGPARWLGWAGCAVAALAFIAATRHEAALLRRDLTEGPVTQECRVLAVFRSPRGGQEFWDVSAPDGRVCLVNMSCAGGESLRGSTAALTYAPHSRLLLAVGPAGEKV